MNLSIEGIVIVQCDPYIPLHFLYHFTCSIIPVHKFLLNASPYKVSIYLKQTKSLRQMAVAEIFAYLFLKTWRKNAKEASGASCGSVKVLLQSNTMQHPDEKKTKPNLPDLSVLLFIVRSSADVVTIMVAVATTRTGGGGGGGGAATNNGNNRNPCCCSNNDNDNNDVRRFFFSSRRRGGFFAAIVALLAFCCAASVLSSAPRLSVITTSSAVSCAGEEEEEARNDDDDDDDSSGVGVLDDANRGAAALQRKAAAPKISTTSNSSSRDDNGNRLVDDNSRNRDYDLHHPLEEFVASTSSLASSKFPLKPPFRILQLGQPRSGSTFQHHLLVAISYLKSNDSNLRTVVSTDTTTTTTKTVLTSGANVKTALQLSAAKNLSVCLKRHKPIDHPSIKEVVRNFTVFMSFRDFDGPPYIAGERLRRRWMGNSTNATSTTNDEEDDNDIDDVLATSLAYVQSRKNLERCSLCEVDRYQPIFGLTDDEVYLLKLRMSLFEKLRLCCGLQMSRIRMLQLHGCNTTALEGQHPGGAPQCDDIEKVEARFEQVRALIPYHVENGDKVWSRPGDCAKFDAQIVAGAGFNGKEKYKFKGCPPELGTVARR